jgi:hypothetical protein
MPERTPTSVGPECGCKPAGPTSSAAWTFRDLEDDELAYYTTQPCECKSPAESGTRNGYICAAHRAQAEIDRRVAVLRGK